MLIGTDVCATDKIERGSIMAENKTKIDIFSGFLGAGKTTLIKKLIQEAFGGGKLVVIANEFGENGVDGGFMRESVNQVKEL